MAKRAGREGKVQDLIPIGRGMRKPVDAIIGKQLALITAIGGHHPYLGVPIAVTIVINQRTIRRIVRAVAMAFAHRQPRLGPTLNTYGVNINHT